MLLLQGLLSLSLAKAEEADAYKNGPHFNEYKEKLGLMTTNQLYVQRAVEGVGYFSNCLVMPVYTLASLTVDSVPIIGALPKGVKLALASNFLTRWGLSGLPKLKVIEKLLTRLKLSHRITDENFRFWLWFFRSIDNWAQDSIQATNADRGEVIQDSSLVGLRTIGKVVPYLEGGAISIIVDTPLALADFLSNQALTRNNRIYPEKFHFTKVAYQADLDFAYEHFWAKSSYCQQNKDRFSSAWQTEGKKQSEKASIKSVAERKTIIIPEQDYPELENITIPSSGFRAQRVTH